MFGKSTEAYFVNAHLLPSAVLIATKTHIKPQHTHTQDRHTKVLET